MFKISSTFLVLFGVVERTSQQTVDVGEFRSPYVLMSREALSIVSSDHLDALLSAAPSYQDFAEGGDLFLIHLATNAERYLAQLTIAPSEDYTRVPVVDASVYSNL